MPVWAPNMWKHEKYKLFFFITSQTVHVFTDVPPLEDMLELIDQSSQLRKEWARNASQGNDPPPAFTPSTNTTEKSDAKDVKPQAKVCEFFSLNVFVRNFLILFYFSFK